MKDRDKEKDLLTVATLILDHCRAQSDGWGLDGKRPFGYSGSYAVATGVLESLGIEPNSEGGYTDEQIGFALEMYDTAGEWMPARWRELTGQPPKRHGVNDGA